MVEERRMTLQRNGTRFRVNLATLGLKTPLLVEPVRPVVTIGLQIDYRLNQELHQLSFKSNRPSTRPRDIVGLPPYSLTPHDQIHNQRLAVVTLLPTQD